MVHLTKANKVPNVYYRPEQYLCPMCHTTLKRNHILWHKQVTFSTGAKMLVSWAYRCPKTTCSASKEVFKSRKAEAVHLKYRRFSRELVVRIGYQHFWQHRTMYEIHDWLTNDLHLSISEREDAYIFVDFLALLSAAQPVRIRSKLAGLQWLIISIDGMQPEKGKNCLYIVRETQCGVTLLAVNLEESSQDALCEQLFEPLKALVQELGLPWHGVVSDAQETIHLAVDKSLKEVPHQVCALRTAHGSQARYGESARHLATPLITWLM